MPRLVDAPMAPVASMLESMRQRLGDGPVHGVRLDLDDTTGWVPASWLLHDDALLDDLLDAAKQRWSAQPHAAAALAWKCYTYWVALPALVGLVSTGRVPLP